MLNQLRAIEKDISEVPDSTEDLNSDMLTQHLQSLSESKNKLDYIHLYIRLNGKIRGEIERKKSLLKQIRDMNNHCYSKKSVFENKSL